MKKLIAICVILSVFTTVSVNATPIVTAPPDAPSWWNEECVQYAYGYWPAGILEGSSLVSPPDDADHWGSNFLSNTAFTATIDIENHTVSIDLDNVPDPDLYKEIYIYITGITEGSEDPGATVIDTDGGKFDPMTSQGHISGNEWSYLIFGEIHPQPDWVRLTVNVPGMTSVTNIWAGENCIPEPATIGILGFGALSLIRRKNK